MPLYYNYAIIRLVATEPRGEWMNAGIVVFRPEGLDIRMSPRPSRLRPIMPEIDGNILDQIAQLMRDFDRTTESIEVRRDALKELQIFRLSELGWFEATTSELYEARLSKLLEDLVAPLPKPPRTRRSRLLTEIKYLLKREGVLAKRTYDIGGHKVVPNYPVAESEGLFADLALKNSVMHVTEVVDLRGFSDRTQSALKDTSLAAVTLHKAKDAFGSRSKGYVLYAVSAAEEKAADPCLRLARDYATETFNAESKEDLAHFLDVILNAARGDLAGRARMK